MAGFDPTDLDPAAPENADRGIARGALPAMPPRRAAPTSPPGELEIRRRVERLFARELAEPSEELLGFVRTRLDLADGDAGSERLGELCRRALREMGRARWSSESAVVGRLASERRQIDRRRFEQHRDLPGYYLG